MDEFSELTRRIAEAPLQPDSWPSVLIDLAACGGGWSAQLFGVANGQFVVDIVGGYTPDLSEELNKQGGADPAISPRPGALMRAPPMTLICDGWYLSARDRDRHPIYREFYERVDGHYCTNAVLESRQDLLIGFAVNHNGRQGAPDRLRQRKLNALLPALKAAVTLQVRLEDQASTMALGVLDSVSMAAFMLDFSGRIMRTSHAAERLLDDGAMLVKRLGKLHATNADSDRELQAAVLRAAQQRRDGGALAASVVLQDTGGQFRIADVTPAPAGANSLRLGACALVIVGQARRRQSDRLLQRLGLTEAESEVARAFVGGASPREIADMRNVSIGTVRAQIKTIYAKLEVSRQTELVAKLREFL